MKSSKGKNENLLGCQGLVITYSIKTNNVFRLVAKGILTAPSIYSTFTKQIIGNNTASGNTLTTLN